MRHVLPYLLAIFLSACASYSGSNLKPQHDSLADVVRVMGEPALRWQDPDGSQQFSYPRGGAGESFMVKIGADGKLQSISNALDAEHFALIKDGLSQEQVLRILGPSIASETIVFARRNELVWTWYFRDYDDLARFHVLFDATKGTVRTTGVTPFRVDVGAGQP